MSRPSVLLVVAIGTPFFVAAGCFWQDGGRTQKQTGELERTEFLRLKDLYHAQSAALSRLGLAVSALADLLILRAQAPQESQQPPDLRQDHVEDFVLSALHEASVDPDFYADVSGSQATASSHEGALASIKLYGPKVDLRRDWHLRQYVLEFLQLHLIRRRLRDAYVSYRIDRGEHVECLSADDLEEFFFESARQGKLPSRFLVQERTAGASAVVDLTPFRKSVRFLSDRIAKLRVRIHREGYLPHFFYDGKDVLE